MKNFIGIVIFLIVVTIFGCLVGGYVANIVKLCKADFEPTYKCEILRGVGIAAPPVGAILGWVTFGEEQEEGD
jgi:hypothetical protein